MAGNAFDTMVGALTENERASLLTKLRNAEKKERIPLESHTGKLSNIGGGTSTEEKLRAESFFLRLILYLKSLFQNTSVTELYNEHRLHEIASRIEKSYSHVIDARLLAFGEQMYDHVFSLKKASDFLFSAVSRIQNDPGEFYMFLGAFLIPELSERFNAEINPTKIELPLKLSNENRVQLQHKLDDLLASIDQAKKNSLYEIVQSIDWLAQFCSLPFVAFLKRFGKGASAKMCPIEEAKSEISEFARVLCNGRVIPKALMEAAAVYVMSGSRNPDTAKRAQEDFIERTGQYLDSIKQFMDAVPLRAIGALAYHTIDWTPPRPQGSEDWFFKFKARWKKHLDTLWTQRILHMQKMEAVGALKDSFDISSLPLLPVRPWSTQWGGIVFEHEYTIGFINFFYQILYPSYEPIIKTLAIEGVFVNKENGIQLSEIMHGFTASLAQLGAFLSELSENGVFGSVFVKAISQNSLNQQKINAVMLSITEEADMLIRNFANYCPQAIDILKGIVSESKNPRYDTITNISTIQGIENEDFRKRIMKMRKGMEKFFELFERIRTITVDRDVEDAGIADEIQNGESVTIDSLLFPIKGQARQTRQTAAQAQKAGLNPARNG